MFKKNITYKYRAKLRYKQLDLIWYLSFSIIGIGSLFFIKFLNSFFNSINSNYLVPNYIYILVLVLLTSINLILFYQSPISFSEKQRNKNKLLQLIEQNHFYYEVNGKIRSSMEIVFYYIQEELHIEVYPLGGKYTYKLDELGKLFETKFNMTLITIQNDYADHTTYILSKNNNFALDSNDYWS